MSGNLYESDKLLGEYLLFHYGRDEEILPWANGPVDALGFTNRTVESLMKLDLPAGVDIEIKV